MHHKVPKCVFLVCFLANQALHSSNTKNSQLTLFFSLKSEVRTFSSECRYTDTYLSKVNIYRLSLGFSQGGTSPWSIKFSQKFCVCFIVFLYMSAGCVSTFRTCVQGYLEWLPFVFCFSSSCDISCPLEKL